ncbi:MAG: hypothetical protein H7259_03595, partial [Cytophagales bacterium]|nr:hypothetical protein [Cytophaga sp.]
APELKPQQYDTRDYSINPPRFETKVMIPKMPTDSLNTILPNYVKAGFGNYATLLGEVFVTNKRSSEYSYGLHAKHLSSQKGSLDYAGTSLNIIEAFGNRYGKVNSWAGHASYSNNRYNYYGLQQDVPVNKDTLKQLYQLFHVGVSTNKIKVGDKFNYTTGIDIYSLSTTTKASETEILWNGKGAYRLSDEKAIGVDMFLSDANRKDSSTINRTLFMIRPTYNITRDNWDLKVGATINYSSDTMQGSKGAHLYPYAHMDYNLLPGKVMLYAGIGGGMEKNTYRSFVQANPYLGSNTVLSHTNRKFDLYVGSTGNISGKVNYKVQMSYASYTNQFFFTNSITDSSQFTVLYDKTGLFAFTGNLFYDLSKEWRVSAGMTYNAWNTDVLAKAWHRPPFQSSIGVQYNLKQKIFFNAEMYYISGIQGINLESNKVVKLKNIVDLSLKAEYRFSKSFSAFLEFNNILSQKYQRYLYYQVKGINVLAGLTYSF